MRLEENMYVRTKYGIITKITSITRNSSLGEETAQARFICEDNNIYDYDKYDTSNDIKGKPSHNIIDLIEVGDYVNGLQVIEVREHLHNDIEIVLTNGSFNWSFSKNESDYKIKSIVTKEQFEQMEYKVGE